MRTKQDAEQNQPLGINPQAPWRIKEMKTLPGFCVDVTFMDGLQDQTLFHQAFLAYGVLNLAWRN